jgi:hypothetical protein
MQTSPTIGKFAEALSKAQGVMKAASKDAENPHFKSKYSDLAAIVGACREALSANGIAILQGVSADEALVTVTTTLAHSSGEWVSSALTARARDASPQSIGSVTSYCKRYGLAALAGVVSDEDDDAEAAQGRPKSKPATATAPHMGLTPVTPPVQPQTATKTQQEIAEFMAAPADSARSERVITEGQRKRLYAISKEQLWGADDVKALLLRYGYDNSKAIRVSDYDALIEVLKTGAVQREPGDDDDDDMLSGAGPAPWEVER